MNTPSPSQQNVADPAQSSDSPPSQGGGVSLANADVVRWVHSLFKCEPTNDDLNRSVHITPYNGAYGQAGAIIAINGSPPKGTVIVDRSSGIMFAWLYGRSRKFDAWTMTPHRYEEAVEILVKNGVFDKDERRVF